MKKLIVLAVVVVMIASLFCACTAPATEENVAEAPADGEAYEMVIVLRMIGDAYYDTIGYGAEEWAKTQSDINLKYVAPSDYDEALQVALLQDVISQKPDAILVSPISNEAAEPVLKEAREQGIVVIVNEAADVENKDYDMEFMATNEFGKNWIDVIAAKCGGKGQYAAMCGSLQNTGEVNRIKAAIEYQKEAYPEMEFVGEIYEPTDDSADGHLALFKEILTTYPDLVGILAAQSVAQAGLAIEETGRVGKTWAAGEAIPSEVHQYIENGSVAASLVADLTVAGGAMASLARAILNGEEVKEGIDLGIENFDACFVNDGVVEANGMLIVTADNHTEYDF